MKKILVTILALAMIFSLCACAPAAPKESTAPETESTAPATEGTEPETVTGEAAEITGYVMLGEDAGSVLIDEVAFVSSNDAEAMAKYGLTEDDMMDDYRIIDEDPAYESHVLAEKCTITVAYSDDAMEIKERTLASWDEFEAYFKAAPSRVENGILAQVQMDAEGAVTAISEIYVP